MARRKIATVDNFPAPYNGMAEPVETREARIYYDSEWNEYRIVFYVNGTKQSGADYHTDDKTDAIQTAEVWASAYTRALAALKGLIAEGAEYPDAQYRVAKGFSVDADNLQKLYDRG
jgi:hypothetical protein